MPPRIGVLVRDASELLMSRFEPHRFPFEVGNLRDPEAARRFVQSAYLSVLRRPADDVGLASYCALIEGGMTSGEVLQDLAESDEYRALREQESFQIGGEAGLTGSADWGRRMDPARLHDWLMQFHNPTWDPGYERYRAHLTELNRIIRSCGVPVEGGLFYHHYRDSIEDVPHGDMITKRRNYALYTSLGRSLLEIGFNAGHSCLLALTLNEDLVYTGVDIAVHSYVRPCFEYLQSVFGDRVRLHIGDSQEVLPVLRSQGEAFDLVHIDGGHGFSVAHNDLCNSFHLFSGDGLLLVDDTDSPIIDYMCDYYALLGAMSRVHLSSLWSRTPAHAVFRVNRPA